jgi:GTP pyrophosphokinase
MRRLLEPAADGAEADEATLAGELDTELVEDRVYVLTPKGEVIDLPAGATPLDFAYRVHTEVGHRCRGAKVDGRIVPLDHRLRSGDRVEIMTAKTGEPRRDWLIESNGFLASSRSREKVRNWFHRLDRGRNEAEGKELLDKELRRLGLLGADLAPARERFHLDGDDDLHVLVALGDLGAHQVARVLLEHERASRAPVAEAPLPTPAPRPAPRARARDFTVQGVDNLLVQLARCCQPLPGEPIAGYLTRGRGVTVHRADCAAFRRLVANQPQRSLPVEWGVDATAYEVDVEVMAVDRKWLLKEITNVIAQANVHVAGIRSDAGRSGARVRFRMRLRVSDYGQLSALLGKLAALPGVEQARRT